MLRLILPAARGAQEVAPGSEWRWVLERMESQLRRGEKAWGVRSLGLATAGIQVARYGSGK